MTQIAHDKAMTSQVQVEFVFFKFFQSKKTSSSKKKKPVERIGVKTEKTEKKKGKKAKGQAKEGEEALTSHSLCTDGQMLKGGR